MSPTARLRVVLFDAHGTLLRLREPVGETYTRLALPYGVELPAARVDEAFGRILRRAPPMCFPDEPRPRIVALERAWWREIVRGTFLAADGTARFRDFEAYFDAVFAHLAEPAAWELMPGARSCLTRLRAQERRLGVASNFDHRLHAILEGLGLTSFFDVVLTPGEAGAAKPDPSFFAAALARFEARADESAYVGDDPLADVAAARAAGLRAIALGGAATLASVPDELAALEQEPRA